MEKLTEQQKANLKNKFVPFANCNVALGLLQEDPELLMRAIKYLNKHE